MPQLSYARGMTPAVPGMVFDLSVLGGGDVVSIVAAAVIPFGVMVELNGSGLLLPAQDTTGGWATNQVVGVSKYDPEGAESQYVSFSVPYSNTGSSCLGYPKGFAVPVVRRGRIWMAFDTTGGSATKLGAFRVWHSSDGSHQQGVATMAATATTTGAEIDTAPTGFSIWNPDGLAGSYTDGFNVANGVLPVSVNL